jgi:dTDP-4-amino-4,6-dideoxy-D-galactose acyltransferase
VADDYVATYVANSVRGFADMVIVPAPDATKPGAFLTGAFDHRHEAVCGMKMARIPLTAVAPERRGWNRRLNSELMHWFKDRGAQLIYTTTQSTNRASIRVLESLHYSYGRSTHVFAIGGSGPT